MLGCLQMLIDKLKHSELCKSSCSLAGQSSLIDFTSICNFLNEFRSSVIDPLLRIGIGTYIGLLLNPSLPDMSEKDGQIDNR